VEPDCPHVKRCRFDAGILHRIDKTWGIADPIVHCFHATRRLDRAIPTIRSPLKQCIPDPLPGSEGINGHATLQTDRISVCCQPCISSADSRPIAIKGMVNALGLPAGALGCPLTPLPVSPVEKECGS